MSSYLTTQHFVDAGLEVVEMHPRIYVVHDFLTQGEVDSVLGQIAEMSEKDWSTQYEASLLEFIKNQYGVSTFEEAADMGYNMSVDSNWVDKNATIEDQKTCRSIYERLSGVFVDMPELEFQGAGSIQRQYEGIKLNYHVDSESNPSVAYAAVMYVNDDFAGGELHFPKLDVKFKPKAKDLIVFPSADEYLHGVLPVEAGPTRYAIPAFINYREN
jgi:hypothetical protein